MTRRLLFRWAGWFALANSVVFGLVSLRYFGGSLPADSVLSIIYLVAVYIGHHVMLTTVPLFVLATPLDPAVSPAPCCDHSGGRTVRLHDCLHDAGQPAVVAKPLPHECA